VILWGLRPSSDREKFILWPIGSEPSNIQVKYEVVASYYLGCIELHLFAGVFGARCYSSDCSQSAFLQCHLKTTLHLCEQPVTIPRLWNTLLHNADLRPFWEVKKQASSLCRRLLAYIFQAVYTMVPSYEIIQLSLESGWRQMSLLTTHGTGMYYECASLC